MVPKESLAADAGLSVSSKLDERSTRVLLDWRVGCYKRVPFPHNFNLEFMKYLHGAQSGLSGFLEDNYKNILDLFLLVTPGDEEYAKEYDVIITAVLTDDCFNEKANEIEQTLRGHWKTLTETSALLNFPQISNKWLHDEQNVLMEIVVKPEDVSLADLMQLKQFNSDFLCYPDDD